MSYQALARKYRPQSFAEVCGQQHALNSLIHALETQKVHHAYLFTGTRGVGKTTLGRLLAKCLNCKSGVTADPCNVCENCVAINEGRFIDLIEIDAASRTGVEETKEILDNIQYMPSQGRYKVYLIDEVHMLSKQSFNALLKTLEEPPEYVKFILATTDYHKIPVTILSRCIQLHLKHISQQEIKAQLMEVLNKENMTSDTESLDYLAHHAKGSLRDALSLLDQAISYCNGSIDQTKIREMLGIVNNDEIALLIDAVITEQVEKILPAIHKLALTENNADTVLDKIAEIWSSSCVYHFTQSLDNIGDINPTLIKDILSKLNIEQVHFLYQLTISAKKDIHLAPSFETGVTMALLRLIAFQKKNLTRKQSNITHTKDNLVKLKQNIAPSPNNQKSVPQKPTPHPNPKNDVSNSDMDQRWFKLLNKINLKGFSKTLAFNSHLVEANQELLNLRLNDDALKILEISPTAFEKLSQALKEHLGNEISINITNNSSNNISTTKKKTPAEIKKENAINKIINNENVKIIKNSLNIDIKKESIETTD